MVGNLYIRTHSEEYIKSVVPLEKTSFFPEALCTSVCFAPFDVEVIVDFAVNKISKLINTTDSLQYTIEVWSEDNSVHWGNLNLDETGVSVWLATETEDVQRALRRLATELSDYVSSAVIVYLTRKSTGVDLKASDEALEDTATSTSLGKATDEDIHNLVDSIRKQTKADITKPKETLADYVCDSSLREELEEIRNFFENEALYKSLNIKLPKGILFKGVPGTGKTYAARCIAGTVDCWFMSCTASALQGMYVGSGAENIRLVFKGAKALKEASKKGVIVFIDEIDSFGSRDSHRNGAGSEEDRTLNQLLAEMSGFEDEEGIMILGATNYPERLDDALMRSGRFSRQITIERPDDFARRNLVEYYFNKIKMPLADTDFDEICNLTSSFTPADIQEVSNETAILAVRKGKKEMYLSDVNEAVNKVITKNIRKPDKLGMPEIVAIHEVGHVVAEALYLKSISLKVTNYSYGSAGGFTQPAKIFEGIVTKSQVKGHVMALLGGRVAEQIYGEVTTGASEDLERAKRSIRAYFEKYHFESFEVKELDQLVEDTLCEWAEELFRKFSETEVLKVIKELVSQLNMKRVLYQSDIAAVAGHFIV